MEAKKRKEESIGEFGFALSRLASAAFSPMTPESREILIIDQFIAGLPSNDMKKHTQFHHPKTLQEAISLATEYESFDGSLRSRKPEDAGARALYAMAEAEPEVMNLLRKIGKKLGIEKGEEETKKGGNQMNGRKKLLQREVLRLWVLQLQG